MRGHAGGASRTRKRCKLKGKHPVRAFGKYQHSVRLFRKHLADSRCAAGRRSCLATPPPPHPPHPTPICTVMLSLQDILRYRCPCVCVDTINLSAGVLTRMCAVVACLLTVLAWIFPFISDCFMPYTYIYISTTGFLLNVDAVKHRLVLCRDCLVAHAEL